MIFFFVIFAYICKKTFGKGGRGLFSDFGASLVMKLSVRELMKFSFKYSLFKQILWTTAGHSADHCEVLCLASSRQQLFIKDNSPLAHSALMLILHVIDGFARVIYSCSILYLIPVSSYFTQPAISQRASLYDPAQGFFLLRRSVFRPILLVAGQVLGFWQAPKD